jgi:predicted DsbA family dithiol-disulfide isomerase
MAQPSEGVAPGTVVVYSDLACPWAHVAVSRLRRTRRELGLEDAVRFDHRAFPLEVFNQRPTPYRVLTAEIPVAGAIEPDAGWQLWQGEPWTWPVTTLLALEAVQAAKSVCERADCSGLEASERLDRALRVALFAESRCISMRHVILDVARSALGAEAADALREALDSGVARSAVLDQCETARTSSRVKGSPHVFLPDGADAHNPGIELHWQGEHGEGFPVIDADEPDVYKRLVEAAAA